VAELTAEAVLKTLQAIEPRAERADAGEVVQTYVENPQLQSALISSNNQVIFGRRGTGKTHALRYLAETVRHSGDLAAYLSMDRLGSTQGLYADGQVPVDQRGVRLLVDVVNEVLNHLVQWAFDAGNQKAFDLCDQLSVAVNELRVDGHVQVTEVGGSENASDESSRVSASIRPQPEIKVELGSIATTRNSTSFTTTRDGMPIYNVHVGAVSSIIGWIIETLDVKRV